MPHNDADDWFYIRSCSTGGVITASTSSQDPLLRSQVYVRPPKQVDEELWRWDDRHLVNKATQLVLDIRKGRLRMLEDTEICIYSKKPKEESVNQLWGVREDDTDSNEIICTSPRTPGSFIIYSYYSSDWVLDIQESSSGQQQQQDSSSKLILFPYQPVDNDRQRWMFIPASNGIKPLVIDEKLDVTQHEEEKQGIEPAADAAFAYGLTPAKRKSSQAMSNAPLAAYKEAYQMVQRHVTQLSNKTVAMAAAYQTLFHKNEGSSDAGNAEPVADQDELQATAQSNAVAILEQYEHLQHLHKDVVMALAAKLVISLYEREHRH